MTGKQDEINRLTKEIDVIRENNCLIWEDIGTKTMNAGERHALRDGWISNCNRLLELLERRDVLKLS